MEMRKFFFESEAAAREFAANEGGIVVPTSGGWRVLVLWD